MAFKDYKEVAKEFQVGSGNKMELKQGENRMRIVSQFARYGSHWVGKTPLVCVGKEQRCPVCKEGGNPRVQFVGWVLDRDDDSRLKLLFIGYQVYKKLGMLGESEDWTFDDLPPYDIVITREGEGLETKYEVTPTKKEEPLTEEQKLDIVENSKDPDEIVEAMKAKAETSIEEFGDDIKPVGPGYMNLKPVGPGYMNLSKEDTVEEKDEEDIDPKDIPF